MQLSKHLTIQQFTATKQAIPNQMPDTLLENARSIARLFDRVKDTFPAAVINSGYRNPAVNAANNGSKNSAHTRALAIDIDSDRHNRPIWDFIVDELNFDLVIWEKGDDNTPAWIHLQVSSNGTNRKLMRRLIGKTYFPCDKNGSPIGR